MTEYDSISGLFAGLGMALLFLVLIGLIFVIVLIVAQWKLFKKAGKNGWEAIIPFYSTWVLIEIAGLNWWYFLISISSTILGLLTEETGFLEVLCNLASLYVNILIFYNLAKKARQNEKLYGVLGAFLSGILVMILGFSKNITIDNSIPVSPNGIFGEPTGNNNYAQNNTPINSNTNEIKYCSGCGHVLTNNVLFCENCGKKVE